MATTTKQSSMVLQRDRVVALKKDTFVNLEILTKSQPMPLDLSRLVFKENALEKPTQTLFNSLSHYLVCIIDLQAATSISWPIYDTKTERAYRNELTSFIVNYSDKLLLSPVTSSFLVNPGCYKVTKLIFQLSQLAVHRLVTSGIKKYSHNELYYAMTEKYKSQEKESFVEQLEKEAGTILSETMRKDSVYQHKRKVIEDIAEKMLGKITQINSKLLNAQMYLDDIVDRFVSHHVIDDETKKKILSIKDINNPSPFFDSWLSEVDRRIDELELKWSEKVSPFLKLCKDTQCNTESLIARHTGEVDKDLYMIEYIHKTDEICTTDLENQVNSEQKYILKNIVKGEQLNFPNLIRGFVIAICFIMQNAEIDDEIYQFNEYLEGGRHNYNEVFKALQDLNKRVMNAETKLEPSPAIYHHSMSINDSMEIRPLCNLSDLLCTRELQCQALFDSFTPLSMSKHKYNLGRKTSSHTLHTFAKPQLRSMHVPSFCSQRSKDDFAKNIISCRINSYEHLNTTQNFHNISAISQAKANETIAECSSGFTKQQIWRLLSTQKSSSSKKFEHKTKTPNINIKKGGLFNESNSSTESNGLFRSYSSPNLCENREKRSVIKARHRKLSIMQENIPLLEVSGITALEKDSRYNTPEGNNIESYRKVNAAGLPTIILTPDPNQKFQQIIKDFNVDLVKEFSIEKMPQKRSSKEETKTNTPKTNAPVIQKTRSVEKLISRFKKVRGSVLPTEDKQSNEQTSEIRTIVEEKVKPNIDRFIANRVLLPDLLSPSCSAVTNKSTDYLDQICTDVVERVCRKPRESLGTALGVDETILDQFDLID